MPVPSMDEKVKRKLSKQKAAATKGWHKPGMREARLRASINWKLKRAIVCGMPGCWKVRTWLLGQKAFANLS